MNIIYYDHVCYFSFLSFFERMNFHACLTIKIIYFYIFLYIYYIFFSLTVPASLSINVNFQFSKCIQRKAHDQLTMMTMTKNVPYQICAHDQFMTFMTSDPNGYPSIIYHYFA